MKITYLGHASLLIETHEKRIIVDPFISGNELARLIPWESLEADYILITHAHGDHILDVEAISKRTGAKLISNYEIVNYFEEKGLIGHAMNTGGSLTFDFGVVHAVKAEHSSSFPDGTYGGNPMGFVLETEKHTIYIAGDTALTYDMKLIPKVIGKLDLVVLPIGDVFTMGIKSAIKASDFLKCKNILGYHYDTFNLIKLNHDQAIRLFKKSHKKLFLLPIGGELNI